MPSNVYSLRWSDHSSHIVKKLFTYRNQNDMVDVTLLCEGQKIKAHKIILSTSSNYFRDLFRDNPCQHPIVIFNSIKFTDLAAIVEFIYQGEVNVPQTTLLTFLQAAETLAIQGLAENQFDNSYIDIPIAPQTTQTTIPSSINASEIMLVQTGQVEPMIFSTPQKTYSAVSTIGTIGTQSIAGRSSYINVVPSKQLVTNQIPIIAPVRKRKFLKTVPRIKTTRGKSETIEKTYTTMETYQPEQQQTDVDDTSEFLKIHPPAEKAVKTVTAIEENIPSGIVNAADLNETVESQGIEDIDTEMYQTDKDGDDQLTDVSIEKVNRSEDLSDIKEESEVQPNVDDADDEDDRPLLKKIAADGTKKWSQCEFCKLIITTVNLWRHIRTQHTAQPTQFCDHCNKRFKNKYSLREHIRIAHESPKVGGSNVPNVI